MKKLGFIGLGIMGRPMARNLLKAGYPLTVYTHKPEVVAELAAEGAAAAESSAQVARASEVIFLMLPNSPQVREVVLGPAGVLEGLQPGSVVVDCSSIDPVESKAISAEVTAAGGFMIDAPVSGGEPKAIDGTLSFMCGGPQEVFDGVKEILGVMGASVTRCGEIGAGNATKLANQIIVAANIAAVAEGLCLAQRLGVDPQGVYAAIRGGLAGSTVLDAKAPMMIGHNFNPGFRIDLHVKDLNNAEAAADNAGVQLPLTDMTLAMMRELQQDGCGSLDHSGLLKYYEKLNQMEL